MSSGTSRHALGDLIGRKIHRGHDGLRRFFAELREVWDQIEWEIQDLIDAGEHVILVAKQRSRGRTSGAEVTGSAVGVWTLDNGKVVRVVWF
jgi:ketosteroid isomerase-like protein